MSHQLVFIFVLLALAAAAMIIGCVYYFGKILPERRDKHERRTIRSGLIKNGYKILKEFPIDLQEKTLTVGYGKTTRTFIYDLCSLGWMLYEDGLETRETKILTAEIFNDAVKAIYGVDDAIAGGAGWKTPEHDFEPKAETVKPRRWQLQRSLAHAQLEEQPQQKELGSGSVAELTRAS